MRRLSDYQPEAGRTFCESANRNSANASRFIPSISFHLTISDEKSISHFLFSFFDYLPTFSWTIFHQALELQVLGTYLDLNAVTHRKAFTPFLPLTFTPSLSLNVPEIYVFQCDGFNSAQQRQKRHCSGNKLLAQSNSTLLILNKVRGKKVLLKLQVLAGVVPSSLHS